MGYKIAIKDNSSGEIRVYESEREWRTSDPELLKCGISESPDAYWWTDGNGGCDCNRALYFEYAIKPREEHAAICASMDPPCGDTRYSIEYVETSDGTRFEI